MKINIHIEKEDLQALVTVLGHCNMIELARAQRVTYCRLYDELSKICNTPDAELIENDVYLWPVKNSKGE
jgi:hypothetical protein